MITNHISKAYSSPLSPEFLRDYQQLQKTRIKMTQDGIKSINEKIQSTVDPELLQIFKTAKTAIDLYA